MENWETLKEKIYFEGEGLRDIYVLDTEKEDWVRWAKLVNEKFTVEFFNGWTLKTEDRINVEDLLLYFTNPDDFTEVNQAWISLGDVKIYCYLYWEAEMENHFNPRSVKTLEDHHAIVRYMQSVATALNKKVILTMEMDKEVVLLEV